MPTYQGELKRTVTESKKKIDVEYLLFWYFGIVFACVPVIIDIIFRLYQGGKIDVDFLIELSLKGDVGWIIATIIGMTIIECYLANKVPKSLFIKIFFYLSILLWLIDYGTYIIIRYFVEVDENKNIFPVIFLIVTFVLTLCFCSPLRIKEVER